MQQLLKTTGTTKADNEIPVPPPQESKNFNYDDLYRTPYQLPGSYTRCSQTVEECVSCLYDMTEEDDVFLKAYNSKRSAAQQVSELEFELVMEVFENTAQDKAPFAAVDKSVLPYSEMLPGLSNINAKMVPYFKELYEYWKQQRQNMGNGPLHPTLKSETHQESDDMDPYVCFRRREVRQTRKTRNRDAQSAEKLKRLRRELEEGRSLILEALQRELEKKELLQLDKSVYETRASLKELKVRLGIKTNDTDLWTQKVSTREPQPQRQVKLRLLTKLCKQEQPKRAPAAHASSGTKSNAQSAVGPARPPQRPQTVEVDLPLLETRRFQRDEELRRDIALKIQNHSNWNRHHVDLTKGPLSPTQSPSRQPFRTAQAQYLLTPPASSASHEESMEEPTPMDLDETVPAAPFVFKGVPIDENDPPRVGYRRRYGRLNLLWIDRRTQRSSSPPRDSQASDRWKYDRDDSEDEQDVYEIDPYATTCIKFRATIPLSFGDASRQRHQWRPSQAQLESVQQVHQQQAQQAQVMAAAAQAMAAQAAAVNGQHSPPQRQPAVAAVNGQVNGQQSPPQRQSGAAAAAAAAVAAARPAAAVQ